RLRTDGDVRGAGPDRFEPRHPLRVLDGGRDGLRLRRLPGLRDPGHGEALPRQLHRGPDPPAREDRLGKGMSDSLAVQLGPLSLKNPILTASGTFGYGLEFTDFVDLSRLGGICTKGLSLSPHAGNAPPRICETPSGMLNAIGLQNVGVEV